MIERLKKGGVVRRRTNCHTCGSSALYPKQAFCKKCFSERASAIYQEKQLEKAKAYGVPADLDGEEWADISGAPGYMISGYGRVKCLNYRDQQRPGIMKLREATEGTYLKIDLDKYNWRPSIHRLVALHFVPNPKNYPYVLHKDENKQNNHKDNLEWGTQGKNMADYIAHADKIGKERRKMPKEKVLGIFNSPDSKKEIAKKYGISELQVESIKNGLRWSSVTGAPCKDKRVKK